MPQQLPRKATAILLILTLSLTMGLTAFAETDYAENVPEYESDLEQVLPDVSEPTASEEHIAEPFVVVNDGMTDALSPMDNETFEVSPAFLQDLEAKLAESEASLSSSSGSVISPWLNYVELNGGALYVDGNRVPNLNYSSRFRCPLAGNMFRTISAVHQPGTSWAPPTEIVSLIGAGAIICWQNRLLPNVVGVWVRHALISCSLNLIDDYINTVPFLMLFDINGNRWASSINLGVDISPRDEVHIPVTPNTATVQRGTTRQFNASVLSFTGISGGVQAWTWTVIGNNSAGTTINSAGVLSVAADETASHLLVQARTRRQLAFPGLIETDGFSLVTVVAPPPVPVSTPTALQNAINNAPANTPTTIQIASDFYMSNMISVPANRQITLASTSAAMRTLSQVNEGERHFAVFGRLTLAQNITLSGGLANTHQLSSLEFEELQELVLVHDFGSDASLRSNGYTMERALDGDFAEFSDMLRTTPLRNATMAGGVVVGPGGAFIMNAGSIIENCMNSFGGAVSLIGSGTALSTRATFTLNGGTIRNNIALSGGGVDLYVNSRMNMNSGTLSGNQVFEDGGAVWVGSGSIASGQGFNMTGGSIVNNLALIDGGGIFTTAFATGYGNIATGPATVFSGNLARGWVNPPPMANRPAHISSSSASIAGYVLNNLDIIYLGHLG